MLIDGETVTVGGQCEEDDFEEGDEEQCGEDGDELQSSDADPLDVTSDTRSLGLYATDTYRLSDRTDLTVSARYNHTKLNLDLHDGEGEASHTFQRINPAIGLTHRPRENLAVYAGYREANRAPTPAELSCADPDDPCRLPNAFVADPPLEQVVARTVEAGMRGRSGSAENGMSWEANVYGSRNDDDLIFVAVPGDQPGLGYFTNFGETQRIGFEVAAQGRRGSIRLVRELQHAALRRSRRTGSFRAPTIRWPGAWRKVKGTMTAILRTMTKMTTETTRMATMTTRRR